MIEEVTFTPGGQGASSSWANGDVATPLDGKLVDQTGYIIDTSGNRILIGGGFDDGNDSSSTTWQPGDNI